MKSKLFNIPKLTNHPVLAQYDFSERFYGKFHFHEEVQITHIKQGEGLFLCGSSSTPYKKNDLFIVGSMLPHVFIGDNSHLCESISIYFKKDWLTSIYPESNYFEHFIRISESGIKINDWNNQKIIEDILNKGGLYRINALFVFLQQLSEIRNEKIFINKSPILSTVKNTDSSKINDILKFIAKNLTRSIQLSELAQLANLTPPSFSRFFKQKTGKTVSSYIMELRVESACKLLLNEELTVEAICYKVGYNNFSNFLRQFKRLKNKTPKQFRLDNYKMVPYS